MKQLCWCLLTGALVVGCRPSAPQGDRPLTEGELPVYSPDGKYLAFQRPTAGGMRLGVLARDGGSVRWLDGAPGNAAQAAWHPHDGSIVYTYGNETQTAMGGYRGKTGWHLRVCGKDGKSRELTEGRVWDYTPTFSPDGRFIYFVSNRGFPKGQTTRNAVFRMPVEGGKIETVLPFMGSHNFGYSMPAISPDGRVLVWASMNSEETWHLMAARVENPARRLRLTDERMVAYSPRWSPCGRYLCFTGYRKGDPTWGVYLTEVRTGACERLFDGREPAFSPDGKFLAFMRGGQIIEHELRPTDFPSGIVGETERPLPAPQPLLSLKSPKPGEKVQLDQQFAFGANDTFYVRMKARAPKKSGYLGINPGLAGRYTENSVGFQILFSKGVPTFALRAGDGGYLPLCADHAPRSGELVDIIGVRHHSQMFVYVSGGEVTSQGFSAGTLALDHPRTLEIEPEYCGFRADFEVQSVEVGRGWPTGMPKTATRKDIFQ